VRQYYILFKFAEKINPGEGAAAGKTWPGKRRLQGNHGKYLDYLCLGDNLAVEGFKPFIFQQNYLAPSTREKRNKLCPWNIDPG